MKKVKTVLGMVIFFLLVTGSAWGVTYTFLDPDTQTGIAANWPGYYNPPTVGYNIDYYGSPHVQSMTVIINDNTRNLDAVQLVMSERLVNDFADPKKYDSLFINANIIRNESYEKWDYYVEGRASTEKFYEVSPLGYSYILAPTAYARINHPAGISEGITEKAGYLQTILWDGSTSTLTYTFDSRSITMGEQWAIGYSEFCANDVVIGMPVPEPATMLLLGLGLVGIAGIRRRFKK